uniref:Endoplasmic reticulum transmembrane protein n=1 Tax=Astyanax mexicanus TaxID=7994 RepID=A0A8B9LEW6_ASTMX
MSLQWTAVATFLYAEVFAVLLLCIPFILTCLKKLYKYGDIAIYLKAVPFVFLLLLRRLASLLSQQATLMASNEAFQKQAEGASDAARKYMEENEKLQERLREAGLEVPEVGGKAKASAEEENKTLKGEVRQLKDELDATKKALQKSDSDVKAMKKQAENLTVEYDRLLEEHAKLQVSTQLETQLLGQVYITVQLLYYGSTIVDTM